VLVTYKKLLSGWSKTRAYTSAKVVPLADACLLASTARARPPKRKTYGSIIGQKSEPSKETFEMAHPNTPF